LTALNLPIRRNRHGGERHPPGVDLELVGKIRIRLLPESPGEGVDLDGYYLTSGKSAVFCDGADGPSVLGGAKFDSLVRLNDSQRRIVIELFQRSVNRMAWGQPNPLNLA
jgi:hypothetical protein